MIKSAKMIRIIIVVSLFCFYTHCSIAILSKISAESSSVDCQSLDHAISEQTSHLLIAIDNGDVDSIKGILNTFPKLLNATASDGSPLLKYCILHQKVNSLLALLSAGFTPSIGSELIHEALKVKLDLRCIDEMLRRNKALLFERNSNGIQPIALAAELKDYEMMDVLMSHLDNRPTMETK